MKNKDEQHTITRLNILSELKHGWLGNDEGEVVKQETINTARSLLLSLINDHKLQPFSIYPTPEGHISLECDLSAYVCEVLIDGSKITGDALCLDTDETIALVIEGDPSKCIADWLMALMLSGKE